MLEGCSEQQSRIDSLCDSIEKRIASGDKAPAPKKRSVSSLLAEQATLKTHQDDIEQDDLFTPNTKRKVSESIQKERMKLVDEVKKLNYSDSDEEMSDDDK